MSREIICADALKWLKGKEFECIVTSMPDMDELGKKYTKTTYIRHFQNMARIVLRSLSREGCAIFYQTDRKMNGLIDKSYLISDVANSLGLNLLWHRICIRRGVGKIDLYRPTYSHILCYSRDTRAGTAFADVIECGDRLYANGMGINAVDHIMKWVKQKGITMIVDPFCGRGTVPAIANKWGIDAIGVDIDPSQCRIARTQKAIV